MIRGEVEYNAANGKEGCRGNISGTERGSKIQGGVRGDREESDKAAGDTSGNRRGRRTSEQINWRKRHLGGRRCRL